MKELLRQLSEAGTDPAVYTPASSVYDLMEKVTAEMLVRKEVTDDEWLELKGNCRFVILMQALLKLLEPRRLGALIAEELKQQEKEAQEIWEKENSS